MSYATQTPNLSVFSPGPTVEEIVRDHGGDFKPYTPRVVIQLPEGRFPKVTERVATALGQQLPFAKSATALLNPDGSASIHIIDHEGIFPRIAKTGEVDHDALMAQLEETLKGVKDAPPEGADLSVDYGSHATVGPSSQLPDGTYDWEAYGRALETELQAGGKAVQRADLDGLRTAYEQSLTRHVTSLSPKNADRLRRGEPISRDLEDRRGTEVLGTTTPTGLTSGIIKGFGAADPLTGLHELVHLFSVAGLEPSLRDAVTRSWGEYTTHVEAHIADLEAKAAATSSPAYKTRLLNDINAARAGIGTTDPAAWGKAQEEHLVHVVLDWVDRGVPINPDMKNVVEHFRNWIALTRKTTRQRGMPPVRVSPAMEGVLNRVFSGPGVETVPYSIEDGAMRMAAHQVVRTSWDEAHATQFYKHDRSMIERSINHQYIGLYPASYMWGKVLPEMLRFLALRPFGMETPFLSWNILREVSDSVNAQSEVDPSFRKFLSDNSKAFLLLSMFFPSLPQDTPANASLPVRRIAEQGLENQLKYAQGVNPSDVKDIDYAKGASDAMFYALGPAGSIRTASQTLGMAGNLGRSAAGLVGGTIGQQQPPSDQSDVLPLR
jgi:hypothetical protein